jgi:hypothetical protein
MLKIIINYTCTHLTEFAVFICLFIYLPDDGLVEVDTCKRDMWRDYLILIVQFVGLNAV